MMIVSVGQDVFGFDGLIYLEFLDNIRVQY